MKEKVAGEYKRRVGKVLESKLNGGNLIKGINTWAVSLLQYSAAFFDCTKEGIKELDGRTRKLMTMHNGFHPRRNVDRVYIPRKEGGRGLHSVEDTVNLAVLGLERYMGSSEEGRISAARGPRRYDGVTEKELKKTCENRMKGTIRR